VLSKQLLPESHGVLHAVACGVLCHAVQLLLRWQLLCQQQQQRLQVDAVEHAGVVACSGVAVA
jgi:hypothetical protein